MNKEMLDRISEYMKAHRLHKRWHKAAACLAVVVVFCTAYALVHPVAALEEDLALDCSYEVHQHESSCFDDDGNIICGYADYVVHTHNADCYDSDGSLVCPLDEVEEHEHDASCYKEETVLACGQTESDGHRHDASCYQEETVPVCGQTENDGHQHDDSCYQEETVPVCGQTESDGHRHDDSCYTLVRGDLVCTDEGEEHQHTDDCYEWTKELACGMEEGAGAHHHSAECYETQTVLICGMEEGEGAHHHSAECYNAQTAPICGMEEGEGAHHHSAECYETKKVLTCEKPEVILHTHSDDCYEDIVDEDGEVIGKKLICGKLEVQEHTHDESCFANAGSNAEEGDTGTPETLVPSPDGQQEEAADEALSTDETCQQPLAEPMETALNGLLPAAVEQVSPVDADLLSAYAVTAADDTVEEPGDYGSYTYAINSLKNAFTADPDYAEYYNENSPLGVAGSFHIVAFDTATVTSHMNGNVLAKTLYAGANFGTNGLDNELSYVQNYEEVNGSSASSIEHLLVIGNNNSVTLLDNGHSLAVNGVKQDKPHHILQDEDTDTAPFIDLEEVRNEICNISQKLAGMEDGGTTLSDGDQNNRSLTLTDPGSIGVCTLTVEQLKKFSGNPLQIKGFTSDTNGVIVINVDCTGETEIELPKEAYVFIDGIKQGTGEVTEFKANRVIWNFTNADGVTIKAKSMTGTIIAPGATVEMVEGNLNGTVVAENVNVKAESHREDFTGQLSNDPGGYELPMAGGSGILPYTIGGLLLVAGAGAFLLYQAHHRCGGGTGGHRRGKQRIRP